MPPQSKAAFFMSFKNLLALQSVKIHGIKPLRSLQSAIVFFEINHVAHTDYDRCRRKT